MSKAHIGIFQNKLEPVKETRPECPEEVWVAAKNVLETKQTQMVRCKSGLYVISYSDNGPFNKDVQKNKLNPKWLPLYIIRVIQWTSGGIQEQDAIEYDLNWNFNN